ncbi:hypothetical protein BGZ83_008763 [Gryganskiella cystojenkinii]|nr:hypothetical protein BGZ83_008763 [Gryganskiella cystojenkinii]
MKISTSVALIATSMAAVASADMLTISYPTVGTVWTVGQSVFVMWGGNCASMGPASKNVTVEIVNGPAEAVNFVAPLGLLDCSGSSQRQSFNVPSIATSGEYGVRVLTDPGFSYTNKFTINVAGGSTPPSAASTAPVASPTSKPNAAGSVAANLMWAVAGAAAVASQLL